MSWLFFGFLLLCAALVLAYAFVHANPRSLAKVIRYSAATCLVLFALAVGFRAGIAAALPFVLLAMAVLRLRPRLGGGGLGSFGPGPAPSPGQISQVETVTLRVTLEHDTGAMDGEVRVGPFVGRRLSDLAKGELVALLQQCQKDDRESAALIQTYIGRHRASEFAADEFEEATTTGDGPGSSGSSVMTSEEACSILGLTRDATHEEIVEAHRNLMKKFHPDRGGSSYLASKINQAKDVLLER